MAYTVRESFGTSYGTPRHAETLDEALALVGEVLDRTDEPDGAVVLINTRLTIYVIEPTT